MIDPTPSSPNIVSWCSSRRLFTPNAHVVLIEGVKAFDGNDFDRVQFNATVGTNSYVGACVQAVDITDMKTSQLVARSELPKAVIEACDIKQNERGQAMIFSISEACSPVYYKEIGPLVGRLFPFKREQTCQITKNGQPFFAGTLRYE